MPATVTCPNCRTSTTAGNPACPGCGRSLTPAPTRETLWRAVSLTSVDLSFFAWVALLVKVSLAAVPAILIVALIWALAGTLIAGFLGA